jgi:protein TonB
MFDRLIEAKRSKGRPAVTVALAAALHAGAVVVALWATRPQPPVVDEGPKGPEHIYVHPVSQTPVRAGLPENKGNRPEPPPKPKRPLRMAHTEPTEPTINIKPEPSDAPVVDEAPTVESNATSDGPVGQPGDGGPTTSGDPNGTDKGLGGPGDFGSRPRQEEEVSIGTPALLAPRPDCRPPQPSMPEVARLAGIDGRVTMKFVVHADGRVDGVSSLDARSPPVLVEAVRAWLEGCTYRPGMFQDRPVAVKMFQTFNFRVR